MEELLRAIEIRNKYNRMDFADFILEYEKFINQKIPTDIIDAFQLIGLNNVDFITMDFVNYNKS